MTNSNELKYSFRRAALTGDERIEITDASVKLFKGEGQAKREIAFADVQKIYSFSNMSAWDEKGAKFETYMTQLTPKRGRIIQICSSSHIRIGSRQRKVAKNNMKKYTKVVDEIKRRVAEANPDATLVCGNIVASVLGYICSLAGLGLIGLIGFGASFGNKSLSEAWPVVLVGVIFGLMFIWWGFVMGKAYWPVRTPLTETINNEGRTRDEYT